MPRINVLIKSASGMCNLHCDYCFYSDEIEKRRQKSYGFMTEATRENIIRRTLSRADCAVSYVFQGGEPTLLGLVFFRKVIELEKTYNKNGIRVDNTLQTNGTLLTEEWCNFLEDNHFLIGLSVDGIRETNDKYRHLKRISRSAFELTFKAAEMMDRAGVEYNILTVVNSETAANIGAIYNFYRVRGWNWQQYIACLDPLGEKKGQRDIALCLTNTTIIQYFRHIVSNKIFVILIIGTTPV